ncbi:hypothetical protein [Dysgonomonas sp. HGC4]|uniref:hypothetical protein n=1 Tax=Dysgonomonas sp. HGC4 TaxID=1658009 RepID=UPI0017828DD2|nr:hypothetical protein [Dysgonomonas sp. HGC4]MBD8347040.1 hypothetical protein [Dysgonomonas sp. HGC4]
MKTFKLLNKIHILFFYKVVRFILRLDEVFLETPDMGWVMNKALFAISFIQMVWFFIFWTIGEIISEKTSLYFFENKLIPIILILAIISVFNYFTLIYKKRWFKYDEEFATYSKTKNRIINIAILSFYIFSIILYFIVVDIWADLRHAGEIPDFQG